MKYTFHHLHLVCSDLEQMIAFFTDTLGAGLVRAENWATPMERCST